MPPPPHSALLPLPSIQQGYLSSTSNKSTNPPTHPPTHIYLLLSSLHLSLPTSPSSIPHHTTQMQQKQRPFLSSLSNHPSSHLSMHSKPTLPKQSTNKQTSKQASTRKTNTPKLNR